MADGEITVKLDDALVEKIEKAAVATGKSREEVVTLLLEQQLFDYDDYDWGDDDPRDAPEEELDPNEPTYAFEDVMREFHAELEKRLSAKA